MTIETTAKKPTISSLKIELENLKNQLQSTNNEKDKLLGDIEEKNFALAKSMMSQKAFLELSIAYGKEIDKSTFQVKKEGFNKELEVLNNQHDPLNQTNSTEFLNEYKEKLINSNEQLFESDFSSFFLANKIYPINDIHHSSWIDAIEYWISLAKDGNKEAEHNLRICFDYEYRTFVENQQIKYSKTQQLSSPNVQQDINSEAPPIFDERIPKYKSELYQKLFKVHVARALPIKHLEELKQLATYESNLNPNNTDEFYGAALCLHYSEFNFEVRNVKNYGSFIIPDKRGDLYLTIINNSEYSPEFTINTLDEHGNINKKEKHIINLGKTIDIQLLASQKVGTIIDSIEFETLGKELNKFLIIPTQSIVIE